MKISLLCPSRGRAERSFATIDNWLTRSGLDGGIETILSIDTDDPSKVWYYRLFSQNWRLKPLDIKFPTRIIENNNSSAVDAINNAALVSTGDILIVVSDDTDCPVNWASKLLNEVGNKSDWIMKCYDGIQPWLITMPVMDRHYYNRFGYIYYPKYKHMFCDTELSCVADLTGRKLNSTLTFQHLHYSTGKSKRDAISDRADQSWHQGEKLFIDRFIENRFGFMGSPHKIQDKNVLNWIDSKIRQRSR